jgi:hypothetical protein
MVYITPIVKINMNKQFIMANLGNLVGLFIAVLSYITHIENNIDSRFNILFVIISIYIHYFAFEYQRITLTIARCVKLKIADEEKNDVFELQELLASPVMGYILLFENIIFGVVVGYLFRTSIVFLLLAVFIKYIVMSWFNVPVPFGYFFRLIDKEIVSASKRLMITGRVTTMLFLVSIFKSMPKDKTYEDWAFNEYGNDLLAQR